MPLEIEEIIIKGECKMKISFTGRNGKLVEKDLNSGRTDYVKVQYAHNPYAL